MNNLEIQISGKVQKSNFAAFEKHALTIIDNINFELVTDQDFLDAKKVVKTCSEVETKLHNAKQAAIHQTEDISALFEMIDKLDSKVREVRLKFNRDIKTKEAKRKQEIIDEGFIRAKDMVGSSPVSHGFPVNISSFNEAAKNKRSLDKLKEAIDAVVDNIEQELETCVAAFEINKNEISNAEIDFPGLFPDAHVISLQSTEVVAMQIESRINKFKLDQTEKKKRDDEAKALREKLKLEAVQTQPEEKKDPAPKPEHQASALTEDPQETMSEGNSSEPLNDYVIKIRVSSTRDAALTLFNDIRGRYEDFPTVSSLDIDKA